ncbi:MAG: NUDIX domain-containing protein, partial [Clostridia bacterium]|nr:NUDIX domain-containing protein [Clostridia bacterium]
YKHHDYTYPVNYGYIPGTLSGDGEEMDVYLLGVDEPVPEYKGAKVIGAIYRANDVEDKLVCAPEGVCFHQAEIAERVEFQEKYFDSTIEGLYQRSCGAIVYRRREDEVEYLCLLQKRSGRYSFPKGHAEAFESELDTALREVCEEIGVSVEFAPDFREEAHYTFDRVKQKTVVLYLAEYNGELNVDSGEVERYEWADIETAKELLPEWYKAALDKAQQYIKR